MTQAFPEGAIPLTVDEAVEAIVTGNHPEADRGSVLIDAALIEGLRSGEYIAARFLDGRLAFQAVIK